MAVRLSSLLLLVSWFSPLCLLTQGVPTTPRCVVLAPNTVTVGQPFTAYVIVHDVTGVRVTLVVSDEETGQSLTNTSVTATKDALTAVRLTLRAPPRPDDLGRRYVALGAVTSAPGLLLPAQARLLVVHRRGHVFTALTRPRYHPGSKVSGRLFSVTEDLRPLPRPLRVDILTPSGRVVARGRPSPIGVATYRFHLKLPADAESGTWRLRAGHGHQFGASDVEYFDVINTNLPALELGLSTDDKMILPTTSDVTVHVTARYPAGTPVNGTVSVELSATSEGSAPRPLGDPTDPKALSPSGQASFTLPVNNHNFRFEDLRGSHLAVKARIMDYDTGLLQTTSDVSAVFVSHPYVIDTTQSSPTYKPSLPYALRAVVVDPFSRPVPRVTVQVREGQGAPINKTTNDAGVLEHVIDMGNRLSNLQWTLETVTGLGAGREARARLVVSRQASPSGDYIQLAGPPSTPVGTYEAVVKFFPTTRRSDTTYNVIHYVVTSKGSVRAKGSVPMDNKVVLPVSFTVRHEMAPSFYLTTFYVRRDTGHVVADGLWVNVTADICQNDLRLTGVETMLPGSSLTLTVQGDPNTVVSTSLVENRLATSGPPLLTRATLSQVLRNGECRHNGGRSVTDVFYWGSLAALTDTGMVVPARTSPTCTPPAQRRHRRAVVELKTELKDFRSSMEVKSLTLSTQGRGEVRTFMSALEGTWQVQAMGMSPTGGFCVSRPLTLRVRRPGRHLQVVLPYEARVNETITVRGLFSWDQPVTNVTAALQADSGLCAQLTAGRWTSPTALSPAPHQQAAAAWPLVPLTAQPQTVRVRVTARNSLGDVTVTVLEHSFNVRPAGVERTVEQTLMMGSSSPSPHRPNQCFKVHSQIPYRFDVKEQTVLLEAKRPPDALHGTGRLEVRVIGEPLGQVIAELPARGLDALVGREPVGCGEQSMMRVGPVVYAASYLRQTDRLSHHLETAVPATILQGLTYMDKFRNETGAYSTWPGKDPSTWLTAYVMKVMAQAAVFTEGVNQSLPAHVCRSALYVAGRQRADGRFDDPLGILFDQSIAVCYALRYMATGSVYQVIRDTQGGVSRSSVGRAVTAFIRFLASRYKKHVIFPKGGLEGPVAMTAYVTISLLEVQRSVPDCPQAGLLNVTVGRAAAYLAGRAANTTDPYTLALMAYGLLLAHHPAGPGVLHRLLATAIDNKGRHWKHWKIPLHSLSRSQRINLIRDPVLTMEIETAAYTLLALVEAGRMQEAGAVASWLTSQHRSNGRFVSTQDTVVGLQALTLYRGLSYKPDLDQKLDIGEVGTAARSLSLTNKDRNVRHVFSYELPPSASDHTAVQVVVRGEGEVRVEVVCAYNSLTPAPVCPLHLAGRAVSRHHLTAQSPCYGHVGQHDACIRTCFSYPSGNGTNMAILYVGLHHLHTPHPQSVRRAVQEDALVDHVETQQGAVIFYVTQIPTEEHCISFVVTSPMALPLVSMPVPIHLYDYHDPERLQCEQFYQPNAMIFQGKRPIETYFTEENQFKCREVAQPIVHDFLEGKMQSKPWEDSKLEKMLCYTGSPANTYALLVQFTDRRFRMVGSDTLIPVLPAKVNKVIKKGPLPLTADSRVEFYVKETWLELENWVNRTQGQTFLVVGALSSGQHTQEAEGTYRLHLDDESIYVQRMAPQRWKRGGPEKAHWRSLSRDLRKAARNNKAYVNGFSTCNA